jgi:hypothetical protein
MNNCDEFIFYDDLAREDESSKQRKRKPAAKKKAVSKAAKPAEQGKTDEDKIDEDKIDASTKVIMACALSANCCRKPSAAACWNCRWTSVPVAT